MCLFSILRPIFIASTVPIGDQNWVCFSILLKVLAISMCRRIQTRMITILKRLIKDHHELFLVLYPGRIVPKFHFLVHLPDIICRFGSPRSYWCMRFEAKNRFFKGVTHGNFKNIPYTLASEHQLWFCHQLYSAKTKENFLYKGDEVKEKPLSTLDLRNSVTVYCVSYIFLLWLLNHYLHLSVSISKSMEWSIDQVQLYRLVSDSSSSDSIPFYYGEITEIYVYNQCKFFVCWVFNFERYDTHYNAVIVTPNCVMTPQLVLYDNLYSPGVVSYHSSPDGKLFIVDKDHPHFFL